MQYQNIHNKERVGTKTLPSIYILTQHIRDAQSTVTRESPHSSLACNITL